jgi:hypothetical protein
LKADVSNIPQTKAWLEKTWKKNFPSALLDYSFSEEVFEDQYRQKINFQKYFYAFLSYHW